MNPNVKRLADYTPSPWIIDGVGLDFDLEPDATQVKARLEMRRADADVPLVLDGEKLKLDAIRIDGRLLEPQEYDVSPTALTIHAPPARFVLETVVTIDPAGNTELSGLYVSGGRFCTQCESEGFRRITYFLDRPDVLTRYKVRLIADKTKFPTLLSNGDLADSGDLPGGRHYAIWHDPYPKPAYLFAVVAGTFESIHDSFTTVSGKSVALSIHVDQGNGARARFAMDALKRSMRWDEEVFKREYDLSQFHIVAVRDFNFGAMENKSLNIFNSSVLLADTATETDADFANVERVVAHEYFHNWTGNRITLRDWFQLCLKEGLTVYRDQEFSADENSRPVQRIRDVSGLREGQFPEDAGPLAHPPRPDAFVKIENFYTSTVYSKGAEVVRVLSALLGPETFQAGMQRYFAVFDGKAATVEDFVGCFAHAAGRDLSEFFRWYTQAGTPRVAVRSSFDAAHGTLKLALTQDVAPTPGQAEKHALPIPLRIGFLGTDGRELDLRLSGDTAARREHHLVLKDGRAEWTFEDVAEPPIPAVMRGFMAPVVLDDGLEFGQRLVQMAHEPDSFTRWDAGQSLMSEAILARAEGRTQDGPSIEALADALGRELTRAEQDPHFAALALEIPTLTRLIQLSAHPDPDALFAARIEVKRGIASRLSDGLAKAARDPRANDLTQNGHARGLRALRDASLNLLSALSTAHEELLRTAFHDAAGMTGALGALRALGQLGGPAFDEALAAFAARWGGEPLVMDKWFSVQAAAPGTDATKIRTLTRHEGFTIRNPNRARSVYGVFGNSNLRAFHAADGSGYTLIAEAVREIDTINPMVASRLVRSFSNWARFDDGRRAHARAALQGLAQNAASSGMLRELTSKILE